MNPQELENSILQMAIQGKLVEQRPEEGTAEDLYKQIQAEKQKLIKAGKIKKEKPLPEISDDEKPFDIPESWKWVRISELGEIVGGGTPKTENNEYWDSAIIPWLTPADMKFIKGKYAERGERNISAIGLKNSSAQLMPKGTILYSSRAPIGYIAIASNDISTNQGFKSLVPAVMEINDFMYYSLMARTSDIVSRASGTTFKEISGTEFGNTIVPLPPLSEQKRIVAKIEELLPYIERYEKAWCKLEDFNKRFPIDLQKSILQMAIQGKLIEQRPEEGTGEELNQQIQAEKQKLIKAGKIKKEKPLPEIPDDEKPFDIPDSWKWVRLGNIIDMLSGFAFKSTDFTRPGKYRLLRGINLGVGKVRWDDIEYIDKLTEQHNNFCINKGDVLLGLDRPWISDGIRVAIFDEEQDALLVQRVLRIRETLAITKDYISLMLRSEFFKNAVESQTTGISVPHISPSQVANFAIPLPPLAEQKRIVAKLEEILPLCEKLKK